MRRCMLEISKKESNREMGSISSLTRPNTWDSLSQTTSLEGESQHLSMANTKGSLKGGRAMEVGLINIGREKYLKAIGSTMSRMVGDACYSLTETSTKVTY